MVIAAAAFFLAANRWVLVPLSLGALVFAASQADSAGWASTQTLGLGAFTVGLRRPVVVVGRDLWERLDAHERLAVLQARPLHAQQDVVGPRGLGVVVRPRAHREVLGRRLKIIGRTVDAKSFTTTPLTFMDYRLAQSLNESDLRGNTTYILVRLAPGANADRVAAEAGERRAG